jgi:uncharacterized membrane protein
MRCMSSGGAGSHQGLALSFRGLRFRGRKFRGLGGWQGKPLHPPFAAVPMGTTVAAALFDVISSVASSRPLYRSATVVLIVGQAFVALAVITGWWDRRRLTTRGTESRQGANAHGWLMLLLGVVGLTDIAMRRAFYVDATHSPAACVIATVLLLVVAIVGGTLGGSLVFEHGVAVEPALTDDSPSASVDFGDAIPKSASGEILRGSLREREAAIDVDR